MDEKIKNFVETVIQERSVTPKELLKEFDGGINEYFGKPVPKRVKTDSVYFSKGSLACMGAVRIAQLTTAEEKMAFKMLVSSLKK